MKLGEILVAQGRVTPADVDEAIQRQKAMGDLWSITSDRVQWAKEELKARRAAVEARYAGELAAVDTDLDELETLERAAGAFAAKHFPEGSPAEVSGEPAVELAELQPAAAEP